MGVSPMFRGRKKSTAQTPMPQFPKVQIAPMPNVDFFQFFRYTLSGIATIYATILTLQSLWGWIVWLSGRDKYISLVRRYVIVHGLRLRVKSFWGDVILCMLLCVVFLLLWYAHGQMRSMFAAYHVAKASL